MNLLIPTTRVARPKPVIPELEACTLEDREPWAAAYLAGASIERIANKVGLSTFGVRRWLIKAGVRLRSPVAASPERAQGSAEAARAVAYVRAHNERMLERINVLRVKRRALPLTMEQLEARP